MTFSESLSAAKSKGRTKMYQFDGEYDYFGGQFWSWAPGGVEDQIFDLFEEDYGYTREEVEEAKQRNEEDATTEEDEELLEAFSHYETLELVDTLDI